MPNNPICGDSNRPIWYNDYQLPCTYGSHLYKKKTCGCQTSAAAMGGGSAHLPVPSPVSPKQQLLTGQVDNCALKEAFRCLP